MLKFEFDQIFTAGLLKGLNNRDYITMPSTAHFLEWMDKINQNHKKGKVNYKVIGWECKGLIQ